MAQKWYDALVPVLTSSPLPTATPTSVAATATNTPLPTNTPTATNTPTFTPSAATPTNTPLPTNTPTATNTPINTPTNTPQAPTATNTLLPTNTPTNTPPATNTPTPTVTPTPGPSSHIIYGANSYGSQEMVAIYLPQNTSEVVGSVAVPTQAMDQDPETGYVYYFDWQTDGNVLAYWDPATASNTIVRIYNPAPGFYAKRMAFAPDGTLYMMDHRENLYTMDKVTGNYTLLGRVRGMVTGSLSATGDMAFTPDGTLYVNTYENLYTLNLATLQPTLIAENMLDLNQTGHTVWTGLVYCDGYRYGYTVE